MPKRHLLCPAHKDFLDAKHPYQYLRIRRSGQKSFLTYKHCHPENTDEIDYFDEYETTVGDPRSLVRILKNLDFRKILVVDKTRSLWELDDIEIAIDEVEG